MFNNCSSLNSLNFGFKDEANKFVVYSAKFMFNNCILLDHIAFDKIFFYDYYNLELSNMFSNCTSLKTVYFDYFYSDY